MTPAENKLDTNLPMHERIYFLDSMRAIAILFVVGVHALGYCVELPQQQNVILSLIVSIAVPVFFFVDGYLFARGITTAKSHWYLKLVRNSLFRLLIPWAIFTLAYTFARYAFEASGYLEERMIIGRPWPEVMVSAYGSVYAPQMYFLLSLFLIRLCSPILKVFIIIKNYYIAITLFIFYYVIYQLVIPHIIPYLTITGGQEPVLHALWGLQFYIAGILLFKTSEIIDLKILFLPFLLSFIISLFIQDGLGKYGANFVQYLYLLSFFLAFTFFQNGSLLLNVIGKNTMGIYLIHAPIVLKGVSLVLNKFIHDPILSYLSILFGTLGLTIFIVMIINIIPYGSWLYGVPYRPKSASKPSENSRVHK